MNTEEDGIEVEINRQMFRCYRNGDVFRLSKTGAYRLVNNCKNNSYGYNMIRCGGKMIFRHRIILYAFTEFDIYNPKKEVDHLDGNKLNNSLENLTEKTHQGNMHNKIHSKGYTFNKKQQKWQAQIKLNNNHIHLGCYNTRWEARQAYLNAIPIYHPSAPIHLYTNDEDDQPR